MENLKQLPLKPIDLRAILEYVPLYRNQIFVVSIDGSVADCDNFQNLATDIAVLYSLGIKIVIVHGIGKQLKDLAKQRNIAPSDVYGDNPVDDQTLALAIEASANVSQKIRDELSLKDLKCAAITPVRPTQVGIISGVDHLNAGKADKIDFETITGLISLGIIPIISPVAPDRSGNILRINSDMLAADLAMGLRASKLIYITVTNGLATNGERAIAVPLNKLMEMLESKKAQIDPRALSKAKFAAKALDSTFTSRAHILNGMEYACLLTEVFDTVGCGTMIYADEYQKIRKARPNDASAIYNISKISVKEQNLVQRTLDEIQSNIQNYFIYEIDGSIIAFVCLNDLGEGCAELASLHVQHFYQGHNVGKTLVDYVIKTAKEQNYKKLFALSTKSAPFFLVCNFSETSPESLPAKRLEKYKRSKRNSKVFYIDLK